jgi:hypothetical protein
VAQPVDRQVTNPRRLTGVDRGNRSDERRARIAGELLDHDQFAVGAGAHDEAGERGAARCARQVADDHRTVERHTRRDLDEDRGGGECRVGQGEVVVGPRSRG